jgi:hypothetical protein
MFGFDCWPQMSSLRGRHRGLQALALFSALGWCGPAYAQRAASSAPMGRAQPPDLQPVRATSGADAPVSPATNAVRKATVVFEADAPGAVLEADASTAGKTWPWRSVCEAPCDAQVVATQTFRIAGQGYYPSPSFTLPARGSTVAIDAEMKSSSIAFPRAVCIVGGSMFLLGNVLLALGNYQYQEGEDHEALQVSGLIGLAGGALIGGTGVVMLLIHSRNKQSVVHVTVGAQ